jgi:AraC-like DNA-binding protein
MCSLRVAAFGRLPAAPRHPGSTSSGAARGPPWIIYAGRSACWIISDIGCTFSDDLEQTACVKSTKRHSGGSAKRTPARRPAEATLRIGATLALPEVLRSLGFDPAAVLAEAGFDRALFDNPDNEVSFEARSRLLAHCVARTGCRHLGLLVGQQGGLHSLGLTGLLVKYSTDLETALRSLVRYAHLHVRGAAVALAVNGDSVMLSYDIHQPQAEATDQVGDGALAVLFNVVRGLCGPDWKPTEVRFAHRSPENVEPFRRFFRAPLRFDAEQYGLMFSADWLNRRLPHDEPEIRRLLQKQVDSLEGRHGDDFPEQVRAVLRTALVTGHADAGRVAALFSMHSRTLSRHLNAFGTGFRELADESRYEIARQMLRDSAMDVAQIAALLDYADGSAFTRAFRRWSGTTPAVWRATRGRTPMRSR